MKSERNNSRYDKWTKTSFLRELKLPEFDLSEGLCGQTDPEVFFPERDNYWGHKAKEICNQCPVRVECLTWALQNDERFGIWGGLTVAERDKLKGKVRRRGRGRPRSIEL